MHMLRELRLKKNLTQKDLAKELNWPRSRITRIECGFAKLRSDWKKTLATFFEVDESYFNNENLNGIKIR